MTLNKLKTKANTKLVEFWDALLIKQTAYYLKHGKYFELLVTNPVIDGVDTTWEIRTPNDEKHLIDVDFSFNSPIPFQIYVHEFIGGNVSGFSARAVVELPDSRQFFKERTLTNTDGVIIINTSSWAEVSLTEN